MNEKQHVRKPSTWLSTAVTLWSDVAISAFGKAGRISEQAAAEKLLDLVAEF